MRLNSYCLCSQTEVLVLHHRTFINPVQVLYLNMAHKSHKVVRLGSHDSDCVTDLRLLTELFFQAHNGNDDDLSLPVHVAQQHCHNCHDAADCKRHPGESVWRPGDPETKVQDDGGL